MMGKRWRSRSFWNLSCSGWDWLGWKMLWTSQTTLWRAGWTTFVWNTDIAWYVHGTGRHCSDSQWMQFTFQGQITASWSRADRLLESSIIHPQVDLQRVVISVDEGGSSSPDTTARLKKDVWCRVSQFLKNGNKTHPVAPNISVYLMFHTWILPGTCCGATRHGLAIGGFKTAQAMQGGRGAG